MYSGEYDACNVTLSVYPHRASLKNMPDHGGNRTYDYYWNTSPMLCQLSYAVWSVLTKVIATRSGRYLLIWLVPYELSKVFITAIWSVYMCKLDMSLYMQLCPLF